VRRFVHQHSGEQSGARAHIDGHLATGWHQPVHRLVWTMTVEDAMLGTYGRVIVASPDDRPQRLASTRRRSDPLALGLRRTRSCGR
jgi:hypothetical protein